MFVPKGFKCNVVCYFVFYGSLVLSYHTDSAGQITGSKPHFSSFLLYSLFIFCMASSLALILRRCVGGVGGWLCRLGLGGKLWVDVGEIPPPLAEKRYNHYELYRTSIAAQVLN